MKSPNLLFHLSPLALYTVGGLILLSAGFFLAGAGGNESDRAWANWLSVSYYLLGLGLGGAVLLSLFSVTGARWSASIEPAAEKLTFLLPVGAFGLTVVLIAFPALYPWAR